MANDDDKPIGDLEAASNDMFIPSATDCDALRSDYIVLVARVLVQYVPCLRIFQDYVPSHIPHEYVDVKAK